MFFKNRLMWAVCRGVGAFKRKNNNNFIIKKQYFIIYRNSRNFFIEQSPIEWDIPLTKCNNHTVECKYGKIRDKK